MRLTPSGANDQQIQPDQSPQPLSLGTRLRQAREARGQTLEQIAAVTRISLPILQALENDNPEKLPSAVTCRAFIKIYAEHLGLTSGDLLAQLAKAEPRLKRVSAPAVTSKRLLQSESFAERPRLFAGKKALPLLFFVLILLAGVILYRSYFSGPEEEPRPSPTTSKASSPKAEPTPPAPGYSGAPAPPAKTLQTVAGGDRQPPTIAQPPAPSPLPGNPRQEGGNDISQPASSPEQTPDQAAGQPSR